jgi:2-C-methyl-D-erythritol 2,4-cyclodiphosphate synthase
MDPARQERGGVSAAAKGFRIGQGYDVHALTPGRKLILGGVEIPFEKGLLGHSDADALLHAVTDALIGAAGLGDIGRHFPDTDPRFLGADSRVLLREALALVTRQGWQPVNVDATLIAQQPRLAPYIPAMRDILAADLCLSPDGVNIKGKTNEKLGYLGRNEAIEAQVVVLLAATDDTRR